ncbi:MAG: roadblock/LC7 domain-containing protein [Candidatus Lokiarchaeota archaeon]|nr:roadblock/LC7 domain-containing protein [Candidatus Lokiarchaeota archaeon]
MSKEEIEPKLANIMSEIAEVEGIVAFDPKGYVISGQTIANDDTSKIAKAASELLPRLTLLGSNISKGSPKELTITLSKGYAVIAYGSKYSIICFVGQDAKNQLGLISRQIKSIME